MDASFRVALNIAAVVLLTLATLHVIRLKRMNSMDRPLLSNYVRCSNVLFAGLLLLRALDPLGEYLWNPQVSFLLIALTSVPMAWNVVLMTLVNYSAMLLVSSMKQGTNTLLPWMRLVLLASVGLAGAVSLVCGIGMLLTQREFYAMLLLWTYVPGAFICLTINTWNCIKVLLTLRGQYRARRAGEESVIIKKAIRKVLVALVIPMLVYMATFVFVFLRLFLHRIMHRYDLHQPIDVTTLAFVVLRMVLLAHSIFSGWITNEQIRISRHRQASRSSSRKMSGCVVQPVQLDASRYYESMWLERSSEDYLQSPSWRASLQSSPMRASHVMRLSRSSSAEDATGHSCTPSSPHSHPPSVLQSRLLGTSPAPPSRTISHTLLSSTLVENKEDLIPSFPELFAELQVDFTPSALSEFTSAALSRNTGMSPNTVARLDTLWEATKVQSGPEAAAVEMQEEVSTSEEASTSGEYSPAPPPSSPPAFAQSKPKSSSSSSSSAAAAAAASLAPSKLSLILHQKREKLDGLPDDNVSSLASNHARSRSTFDLILPARAKLYTKSSSVPTDKLSEPETEEIADLEVADLSERGFIKLPLAASKMPQLQPPCEDDPDRNARTAQSLILHQKKEKGSPENRNRNLNTLASRHVRFPSTLDQILTAKAKSFSLSQEVSEPETKEIAELTDQGLNKVPSARTAQTLILHRKKEKGSPVNTNVNTVASKQVQVCSTLEQILPAIPQGYTKSFSLPTQEASEPKPELTEQGLSMPLLPTFEEDQSLILHQKKEKGSPLTDVSSLASKHARSRSTLDQIFPARDNFYAKSFSSPSAEVSELHTPLQPATAELADLAMADLTEHGLIKLPRKKMFKSVINAQITQSHSPIRKSRTIGSTVHASPTLPNAPAKDTQSSLHNNIKLMKDSLDIFPVRQTMTASPDCSVSQTHTSASHSFPCLPVLPSTDTRSSPHVNVLKDSLPLSERVTLRKARMAVVYSSYSFPELPPSLSLLTSASFPDLPPVEVEKTRVYASPSLPALPTLSTAVYASPCLPAPRVYASPSLPALPSLSTAADTVLLALPAQTLMILASPSCECPIR
eukprot:g44799.t1